VRRKGRGGKGAPFWEVFLFLRKKRKESENPSLIEECGTTCPDVRCCPREEKDQLP